MRSVRTHSFAAIAGALLCLPALLAPRVAAAQAPSDQQAQPTLAPDPRDAGFAAWRDGGADGVLAAPHVLKGERYQVLIQSAALRNRSGTPETLREAIDACAQLGQGITDASRVRLVVERAFQALDRSVAGQPLVALTIVPVGRSAISCTNTPAQAQALLEFGIEFGHDTIGIPAHDAASVVVEVGGRPVRPSLVGLSPMRKIAPQSYVGGNGLNALRVYLSLEALAPTGQNAAVRLRILNGKDSVPTEMDIPSEVVSAIHRELVGWSARRLAEGVAFPPEMPISLPRPRDALLRASHDQYRLADYAGASVAALARVDARRLEADDRTSALMQLALTLAASGDEPAARVLYRDAAALEPCLRLPETLPPRYQALFDEYRPARRCEPVGVSRILRASIVPGGITRSLYPERRGGAGAVQIVALVAAVALRADANRLYKEYQAEASASAPALYEYAAERHRAANFAAVGVWVTYAWPVVRAIQRERRLERRSSALSNYGAVGPRVSDSFLESSRPSISPAAQGVGLAFFFF